ncbi:hypothetical protein BC828DRAFT_382696 [Blastocladiella britannica]|nr:hypothetical protein BC828DRAFT_382696 [Blastocladiella britannica]
MSTFTGLPMPDSVTNTKLALAVVGGIMSGIKGLEGGAGLLLFVLASTLASISAVRRAGIHEDDLGGKFPIAVEGLPSAMALYILAWTLVYNLLA